jgi:D-arabinose 1-dehydrogenase-like Zn-dependent alcohol dehydrogenase
VPGHELVGIVTAVGAEVKGFAVGDKVGVGWCGVAACPTRASVRFSPPCTLLVL